MASNQTPNLQLCQWEAEDEVLRADFNADNAKLDAAVMERFGPDNLPWVMGKYSGSAETYGGTQDIVLGFKPKLLIVVGSSGCLGLATRFGEDSQVTCTTTNSSNGTTAFISTGLALTETGFQAKHVSNVTYGLSMNFKGWSYIYFALQ